LTEDGGNDTILLRPDGPAVVNGIPQSIYDYVIMSARERTASSSALVEAAFGSPEDPIQIDPFSANRAARFQSVLRYEPETDSLVNQFTGVIYRPVQGTFRLVPESVPPDLETPPPEELRPGYYVTVGLENFTRLFRDQSIWGRSSPFSCGRFSTRRQWFSSPSLWGWAWRCSSTTKSCRCGSFSARYC